VEVVDIVVTFPTTCE